ncbi:MAG: hypothetical protein V1771_01655 [Chloroflexota bacterium]
MAEFLTTSGVSSNLERIVGGAQKRLVLISPYLQFPAILFERLQQADRRGVQIVFIYGKKELKDEEQSKLKQCGTSPSISTRTCTPSVILTRAT